MKKYLMLIAALAAAGLLLRMPHPARDISKLLPVQTLYLYIEEGLLQIETDTGDRGSGHTLTEAAASLKSNAPGEVFLDTAQFLILHPDVPITEEFYSLLRPSCRVAYTDAKPDLPGATQYLENHKPELTMAQIRADQQISEFSTKEERSHPWNDPQNKTPSGSSLPSLHPSHISPAAAG